MDAKAAFEKHIRETYQYPQLEMEPDDSPCTGEYVDTLRQTEYEHWCKSWQASRAAIDIEREPEHEWMGEYPSHDSFLDGYANGWNDCVDAITSHGIRIKGKSE